MTISVAINIAAKMPAFCVVFRSTLRALVVVPVDADVVGSLGIETTGSDLGDTDSGDATGDKV